MKCSIIVDKNKLKKPSSLVTSRGEADSIIKDLEDTLEKGRGLGLSACQIGIYKQVSIIRIGEFKLDLINPIIVSKNGKFIYKGEGCLSFPYIYVDTDRWQSIFIEHGLEERKQSVCMNLESIVIQHEIDHQKGITIFDRKHKRR